MPGKSSDINKSALLRIIALIAGIIFLAAGWFWWRNIYMGANNVFWEMIDNNLSTASVTRQLTQKTADKSLDQFIREQFGAVNAAENYITLRQKDANGESIVKTVTIGTPDADYSKYISISSPSKSLDGPSLNASKVLGVWGKSTTNQAGAANYFQQSVLTIVPFGNFTQEQKSDLINKMHSYNIYDVSISSAKSEKYNNRAVYIYNVDIAPASYVQMMQTYTKYLGIGDIGLDPSVYARSPALKAELTVDKLSRQLVKISYPESKQSVTITDQNLDQPIKIPDNTIPIAELQLRLQKIVQ